MASLGKININGQHKRFFLKKPLYFWVRLILGIIFALASINKIIHPASFAEVIYNYQILPNALINPTAIVLPWLELILGTFLILGLWLPGAVLLSNLLLVIFFVALVFNLARGLDIQCGCFITGQKATSNLNMSLYVIRDGIFVLLALYLFYHTFLIKRQTVDGKHP